MADARMQHEWIVSVSGSDVSIAAGRSAWECHTQAGIKRVAKAMRRRAGRSCKQRL